jgi:hypothetical protein
MTSDFARATLVVYRRADVGEPVVMLWSGELSLPPAGSVVEEIRSDGELFETAGIDRSDGIRLP